MIFWFLGCSSESSHTQKLVLDTIPYDIAVAEHRLKPQEKVWARLPWFGDYEKALEESQKQNRPIFFFSMFGELDGRC